MQKAHLDQLRAISQSQFLLVESNPQVPPRPYLLELEIKNLNKSGSRIRSSPNFVCMRLPECLQMA